MTTITNVTLTTTLTEASSYRGFTIGDQYRADSPVKIYSTNNQPAEDVYSPYSHLDDTAKTRFTEAMITDTKEIDGQYRTLRVPFFGQKIASPMYLPPPLIHSTVGDYMYVQLTSTDLPTVDVNENYFTYHRGAADEYRLFSTYYIDEMLASKTTGSGPVNFTDNYFASGKPLVAFKPLLDNFKSAYENSELEFSTATSVSAIEKSLYFRNSTSDVNLSGFKQNSTGDYVLFAENKIILGTGLFTNLISGNVLIIANTINASAIASIPINCNVFIICNTLSNSLPTNTGTGKLYVFSKTSASLAPITATPSQAQTLDLLIPSVLLKNPIPQNKLIKLFRNEGVYVSTGSPPFTPISGLPVGATFLAARKIVEKGTTALKVGEIRLDYLNSATKIDDLIDFHLAVMRQGQIPYQFNNGDNISYTDDDASLLSYNDSRTLNYTLGSLKGKTRVSLQCDTSAACNVRVLTEPFYPGNLTHFGMAQTSRIDDNTYVFSKTGRYVTIDKKGDIVISSADLTVSSDKVKVYSRHNYGAGETDPLSTITAANTKWFNNLKLSDLATALNIPTFTAKALLVASDAAATPTVPSDYLAAVGTTTYTGSLISLVNEITNYSSVTTQADLVTSHANLLTKFNKLISDLNDLIPSIAPTGTGLVPYNTTYTSGSSGGYVVFTQTINDYVTILEHFRDLFARAPFVLEERTLLAVTAINSMVTKKEISRFLNPQQITMSSDMIFVGGVSRSLYSYAPLNGMIDSITVPEGTTDKGHKFLRDYSFQNGILTVRNKYASKSTAMVFNATIKPSWIKKVTSRYDIAPTDLTKVKFAYDMRPKCNVAEERFDIEVTYADDKIAHINMAGNLIALPKEEIVTFQINNQVLTVEGSYYYTVTTVGTKLVGTISHTSYVYTSSSIWGFDANRDALAGDQKVETTATFELEEPMDNSKTVKLLFVFSSHDLPPKDTTPAVATTQEVVISNKLILPYNGLGADGPAFLVVKDEAYYFYNEVLDGLSLPTIFTQAGTGDTLYIQKQNGLIFRNEQLMSNKEITKSVNDQTNGQKFVFLSRTYVPWKLRMSTVPVTSEMSALEKLDVILLKNIYDDVIKTTSINVLADGQVESKYLPFAFEEVVYERQPEINVTSVFTSSIEELQQKIQEYLNKFTNSAYTAPDEHGVRRLIGNPKSPFMRIANSDNVKLFNYATRINPDTKKPDPTSQIGLALPYPVVRSVLVESGSESLSYCVFYLHDDTIFQFIYTE